MRSKVGDAAGKHFLGAGQESALPEEALAAVGSCAGMCRYGGRQMGAAGSPPEEGAQLGKAPRSASRLLVAGEGELGQGRVTGALLRLLDGCQVHMLSLPTLLTAGQGDVSQGAVSLVQEAFRRRAPPAAGCTHCPPHWPGGSNAETDVAPAGCSPPSHASSSCPVWRRGP